MSESVGRIVTRLTVARSCMWGNDDPVSYAGFAREVKRLERELEIAEAREAGQPPPRDVLQLIAPRRV